jgi:hypothetical protein
MVVSQLGMLASMFHIVLFMGLGGFAVRLSRFVVMGSSFVVVVFWHEWFQSTLLAYAAIAVFSGD